MKLFIQNWIPLKLRQQLRPPVLALLVVLAVAVGCIIPAKTLIQLPAQHAALDRELMQVQTLAAQAITLQGKAVPNTDDHAALLQSAVTQAFGTTASVQINNDSGSAVLLLKDSPVGTLASGLENVRQNAQISYLAARLTLQGERISGNLDLQLPGTR